MMRIGKPDAYAASLAIEAPLNQSKALDNICILNRRFSKPDTQEVMSNLCRAALPRAISKEDEEIKKLVWRLAEIMASSRSSNMEQR